LPYSLVDGRWQPRPFLAVAAGYLGSARNLDAFAFVVLWEVLAGCSVLFAQQQGEMIASILLSSCARRGVLWLGASDASFTYWGRQRAHGLRIRGADGTVTRRFIAWTRGRVVWSPLHLSPSPSAYYSPPLFSIRRGRELSSWYLTLRLCTQRQPGHTFIHTHTAHVQPRPRIGGGHGRARNHARKLRMGNAAAERGRSWAIASNTAVTCARECPT